MKARPVAPTWVQVLSDARAARAAGANEDAVIHTLQAAWDSYCISEEWPPELVQVSDALNAEKRKHGLEEDEDWPPNEEPETVRTLRAKWERIADAWRLVFLRAHGEEALARLCEQDPEEYRRRVLNGRRLLFGPRSENDLH